MENRARVTEWFGVAPDQLMTCRQVHSPTVTVVEQTTPLASRPEADAMVTKSSNIILGFSPLTAHPCYLPIPKARVIGAAHAGWKEPLAVYLKIL